MFSPSLCSVCMYAVSYQVNVPLDLINAPACLSATLHQAAKTCKEKLMDSVECSVTVR